MSIRYRVSNIDWDNEVDGQLVDVSRLPREAVFYDRAYQPLRAVEEQVADQLSDIYGFCVHGFEIEAREKPKAR